MVQRRRKEYQIFSGLSLSLEKRHYRQSTINQLKISDDAFAISDKDILTESASFYKNLYQSKGNTGTSIEASVFFDGENDTSLKDHEKEAYD